MRLRRFAGAAAAGCVAVGAASGAMAQAPTPLVADISSREIAISTGFAGAELLLFGAIEGRGDVAIVVRGPRGPAVVRKKERIAGIWLNSESRSFANLPVYYRTASTRPLARIAPHAVLERYEIGVPNLRVALATGEHQEGAADFREAFLRNKVSAGLYDRDVTPVTIIGGRLFRATVWFPPNVPVGLYQVEMYLFRDGRLVSRRITPLVVRKVGIEAQIFEYAHQESMSYGLIAIGISLMAGWLGALIFRRA